MKTIFEIPTVGGRGTMPGGIALRYAAKGEFVVHNYNTDTETGTERHYWQGSYFNTRESEQAAFAEALTEFTRRAAKQTHYSGGGEIDIEALTA